MSISKVVILRGPSGCGKTHYVQSRFKSGEIVVHSADNFFYKKDPNGLEPVYEFDPSKLGIAHAVCFNQFARHVSGLRLSSAETAIVDNTNIHLWEYENYILLAEICNCQVSIVEWNSNRISDLNKCYKRNQHNVPLGIITKHFLEFEPYTGKHSVLKIEIS